jgi:hypothetical protein
MSSTGTDHVLEEDWGLLRFSSGLVVLLQRHHQHGILGVHAETVRRRLRRLAAALRAVVLE